MNQGGEGEIEEELLWIVEPRDEVSDRVRKAVEDEFESVECFSDARRAVIHSHRQNPELIILGLAKNTIDPGELLVIRRDLADVANVPLIVLYGSEDVVDVDEVMVEGVADAVEISKLEEELPRRVRWQRSRQRRNDGKDGQAPKISSIDGLSELRTFDFLTRVIEASPNAIVAARRSGEIVLFNPAAEDVLGWSKSEVLGMNVRRLYPPGGAERIMQLMRSQEHGGHGLIQSLREVVVRTDGELIPVEISAALVYESDREIATVGIFTDLREQMKMEERLHEAMEALEETQRQAVIAEVAGAAAHRLNQPLTSLLGYVEYLRQQYDEDDEMHRVVSTIHDDASQISQVVRKIGRVTRYRTREYAGGEQIVDLEEASHCEEEKLATRTSEMPRIEKDDDGEGEHDGQI